jgi:hypothetical protein
VAQILNFDFKKDCGPQAPSPAFFKVGEISRLSSMSVAKTHQLKAKSQWPRAGFLQIGNFGSTGNLAIALA